jgi:hypothetical protein
MADSGVGAISLSWWGRESYSDLNVPRVMDVMRDHDIRVTFGLEPYRNDRGVHFATDVEYLLREYGERRGWDAFLLLPDRSGRVRPVFKTFRSILPEVIIDCHGMEEEVRDYTPDDVWNRQIETLRERVRHDFEHVSLLADSLDMGRTRRAGFDGIGIYDNFIPPEDYRGWAELASREGLVFSFNVNPGYDEIERREVPPVSCYTPRPFIPGQGVFDWSTPEDRELAAQLSAERIRSSFAEAVRVQTTPELENSRQGFFALYINSFNEWHEGHAFEPMKPYHQLSDAERSLAYHNSEIGTYRLDVLARQLAAAKIRRG